MARTKRRPTRTAYVIDFAEPETGQQEETTDDHDLPQSPHPAPVFSRAELSASKEEDWMKATQDVALGAFFAAIGIVAGAIALTYPIGTPSRMGPGFFPVIISVLMTLTGMAVLLRAHRAGSPAVEAITWRPVVIVPLMVVVFGLTIDGLGLPLAVFVLVVGTAAASVKFEISWKAAAGAVAFSAICALLFVKVLGLPIPLAGSWLPFSG
ncbi:MAG: tripartite tricarboxylate transporter TctB family protein [Pseudomonadota bacterium]